MRILAQLVSCPPIRNIGSELMTLRLLRFLASVGHDVAVTVVTARGRWDVDGVPIYGSNQRVPRSDVVLCHPDFGAPARATGRLQNIPIVAVCHNIGVGVRVGLHYTQPDLVVVNSQAMREDLRRPDAIVVNPPPPHPQPMSGGMVTTLSLNELKGGRQFWDIARAMPWREFLAVKGGYGEQIIPSTIPANVTVLDHVPSGAMDEKVWSRTGVFLQLSESESWGMAASEAISHGIPVIAHPTPGIIENLGNAASYVDRDEISRWVLAIDSPPSAATATDRGIANHAVSEHQLSEFASAIERLESQWNRSRVLTI